MWANPDVGNFPDNEARAAGLRALYPLSSGSSHCHYNPAKYSEADALKIAREVGYKGLFSIEAEAANNGPDPYVIGPDHPRRNSQRHLSRAPESDYFAARILPPGSSSYTCPRQRIWLPM